MTSLSWPQWLLFAAALVAGGAAWFWRRGRGTPSLRDKASARASQAPASMAATDEAPVALESVRALDALETVALSLLCEAFPRAHVLAHVPLARFIRLPPRQTRPRWMQDASSMDADLLLCDARFRVLAVIDVRNRADSAAHRQRSDQGARVVRAAGLPLLTWHEGSLRDLRQIRESIWELVDDPVLHGDAAPGAETGWAVHPAAILQERQPAAPKPDGAQGTAAAKPAPLPSAPEFQASDLTMLERAVLLWRRNQA